MINQLINFIMMDLNLPRLKKLCEEIGTNPITFININKEDFLNKEFSLMVLNEFIEIRQQLEDHMNYEKENGINMWDICNDGIGFYMPGDIVTEGEMHLNSIICCLEELLENLE